jgi:soluble lytic murein transglycosylase-like protein
MLVAQHNTKGPTSKQTLKKPPIGMLFLGWALSILSTSCLADDSVKSPKSPHNAIQSLPLNDLSPKLQNTQWWTIARHRQIDPYILYAVALVESANSDDHATITPWPWAINKSGKSIISASKQDAQRILANTIAEGNRHIDIGMMQINLYWHGHKVAKPEQLLNPITNLEIGAKVLAEAIQSSPNNLELGIGRYHSWQNAQAAVQYGQRVIALANQIRALI